MSGAHRAPAVADAALPATSATGTQADKKAYKAALGFEQVLLGELVKEMTKARRRSTRARAPTPSATP